MDDIEDDSEPRLTTGGGRHEIYIKASHLDADDPDLEHTYVWWFSPTAQTGPEDARLEVSKYLHKTWRDACSPVSFAEEHDGETVVDSAGWPAEDITMDEVPDKVIKTLMKWFGRDLVERSVEHDDGQLPEYVYECVDCDGVFEMTPRRTCPNCGGDSLVKHASRDTIGESRELLETLNDAEVTVTSESTDEPPTE